MTTAPPSESARHQALKQERTENSFSPLFLFSLPEDVDISWWQGIRPERRILRGKAYKRAKRLMDLLLIFSALPVILPLALVCSLLIKLESPQGPILFKQERTGKSGHRFQMFKFRTMVHDAEDLKLKMAHLNERQWPDFKITNDPRITKFGRFLRKSSLDEVPQLLNVLKGEMSLVGPRPTSFKPATYQLWHTERLDVLPGMTGLWQVLGRGSMEFDDRVRLDVAYVQRRCLWLDIQILVHTVTVVFQQEGAY